MSTSASRRRTTLPVDRGQASTSTSTARPTELPVAMRVMATGREVPLSCAEGPFTIGSDPTNALVLDDRYVSAFHCELIKRGAHRFHLRDRGSLNGTFVNGQRLVEGEVRPGARLVVGETALSLVGRRGRRSPPAAELLIGDAPMFRSAVDRAVRAGRGHATVLIVGESGTGKELIARLVHESSARASGPFVAVNCGAISRELVESELFGHERGAFTGASERRLGLFEQAHGGTIFLDEIGELPPEQQPRLLRVLETHRVRRVGGETEREIDVRVIAATHRELGAASVRGAFRLDLYHRLAGLEVRLPPLRDRLEDLPLLIDWFLAEVAAEHGPRRLAPATLAALARHPWPGNVRELKNAIERAALLSDDELQLTDLLPPFATALAPAKGLPTHAPMLPEPMSLLACDAEGAGPPGWPSATAPPAWPSATTPPAWPSATTPPAWPPATTPPGWSPATAARPPATMVPTVTPNDARPAPGGQPADPLEGLTADDMIRALMERALKRCGSQRRAAAALRMSKSTFHDKAKRYGLIAPRIGTPER